MSLLPRDRWPVVSELGQRLLVFAWEVVATGRTGVLLSNICDLPPEGGKKWMVTWTLESHVPLDTPQVRGLESWLADVKGWRVKRRSKDDVT